MLWNNVRERTCSGIDPWRAHAVLNEDKPRHLLNRQATFSKRGTGTCRRQRQPDSDVLLSFRFMVIVSKCAPETYF